MKKKIILTILASIFFAFLIYKITYHEEMNFLALGDGLSLGLTAYNVKGYSYNDYLKDYFEENTILREYIADFASVDETSKSLLTKITNNEILENNNLTIQQAISKAKIITISIGMDELNNLKNLKTKNINNYLENVDKILKIIRNINKNKIIITSLYETNKLSSSLTNKINNELNTIASKYHVTYLDISNVASNPKYYMLKDNYYLNYQGHYQICELIKEVI